jgi:hypothetical protein
MADCRGQVYYQSKSSTPLTAVEWCIGKLYGSVYLGILNYYITVIYYRVLLLYTFLSNLILVTSDKCNEPLNCNTNIFLLQSPNSL